MSISSEVSRNEYVGNSATTTFPITFPFFSSSDLKVIKRLTDGTQVVLTGSDYSVVGTDLILPLALPSGEKIVILRDLEFVQETEFRNQGEFYPEVVEDTVDKTVMMAQQLKEKATRSLVLAESTNAFDATFPPDLDSSPGASVIVNPTANGFTKGPTANEISNAQSYANAAAASMGAAATSETNAANSAAAAATSETNAGNSASAAATSETNASASATAASNSATAASGSATSAAGSASAASTSATNAANSATASATSATNSANSASSAATSEANALASKNAAALSSTEAAAAVALITYPAREAMLIKKDPFSPCFTKTGAQTISIKAGTGMVVDNTFVLFSVDTAVVMPALSTGTDYAIYICKDGTVRADANFTAPTGYTTTNSKQAGGFHYGAVSPTETVAGGSFATTGNGMIWTQGDVDKLKGINQFSIWDLKFRPACSDPRGMALVANRFWVDIYFCNTNPEVNGTSKYNSDVASGTVLPKKPTMFGGNGTATYANLNGWTANELARAFGKRFMKESEFVVAAFGVTEDQSLGGAASTITNAIRQAGYTSKWGLEQATGHHWTWGEDTSIRPTYAADAWGWRDVNGDRGQRYLINSLGESRILLGGDRDNAAYSGSRAAFWNSYPWNSYWSFGLRAACDHLQLV